MNRNEFDVLSVLAESNGTKLSQRAIAKMIGKSVGTVNSICNELNNKRLISNGVVTETGFEALEPYRVRKMLIIAAGFGSRLAPVTLNTPKPLVRVKGQRIIDSLLDAAIAADIDDITIVRGYLGEQFDQLLKKYPNIKFIENPYYNEANNVSSIYIASTFGNLENTYIAEADLLVSNPDIIRKYQYVSNYLGVNVDRTDDWCFFTNGNRIEKLGQGGYDCYHMFGISYWTSEDGKKLSEAVKKAWLIPGGKEKYWDQVPLELFKSEFEVEVRKCSFDDITEIDTFKELQNIDHSYCY